MTTSLKLQPAKAPEGNFERLRISRIADRQSARGKVSERQGKRLTADTAPELRIMSCDASRFRIRSVCQKLGNHFPVNRSARFETRSGPIDPDQFARGRINANRKICALRLRPPAVEFALIDGNVFEAVPAVGRRPVLWVRSRRSPLPGPLLYRKADATGICGLCPVGLTTAAYIECDLSSSIKHSRLN